MLNVDCFLEYLRGELNRSQMTVESYREDLAHFEEFARNLSDSFSWETVDSDTVRLWMENMMDKGNAATTVNRRLSALRTFYRFALSRKYIETDPVCHVKGPKKKKPLPQFLKEGEMDELLGGLSTEGDFKYVRARTIMMALYETGMRLSELRGLNEEDVNFRTHEIKVTGKGNKQRIIPFGGELDKTLGEYLQKKSESVKVKTSALICSTTGSRLSASQIRRIVKEYLSMVSSLKKRSPHVLRHTFATAMLNHEAEIESVKKLLGHAKLSTTEIYTHTTFEQLKRVYNKAHPRA